MAAATTAATIVDGLVAVIHVLDSHGQGHAPSIARGMIESLLDLTLICKDERYLRPLLLASAIGTSRYVEVAVGMDDSVVPNGQKERLRRVLAENAKTIEKLKGAGVKTLEPDEKFALSEQEPKLRFYYRRYIASVHNNFDAVLSRHLRGDEILLGTTLADYEVTELLSIASSVAAETLRFLPKFSSCTERQASELHDGILPQLRMLAAGEHPEKGPATSG